MHSARQLLVTLALLCFPVLVQALPSDRQQPIHIESDRAERNKNIIVYRGNVIIKQGTILIRAAKVVIHSTGDSVSKIVCTGKPAHYQQRPSLDGGLVRASANTIEYWPARNQMHLINNASLEQAGTTITGERIDYDIAKEVVKAKGDNSGGQRIQMVIPPSSAANIEQPNTDQQDSAQDNSEPVNPASANPEPLNPKQRNPEQESN